MDVVRGLLGGWECQKTGDSKFEAGKEGNIALRIINTYPKASVIEIVNYFCSNRKTDTYTWYYPLS